MGIDTFRSDISVSLGLMPFSSAPRISTAGPVRSADDAFACAFSVAETAFTPDSLRKVRHLVRDFTLHTGKVLRAPAEAFTASGDILAEFFSGMMTASAPKQEADRTTAPKFRTSVTPSSISSSGSLPSSKIRGRMASIS